MVEKKNPSLLPCQGPSNSFPSPRQPLSVNASCPPATSAPTASQTATVTFAAPAGSALMSPVTPGETIHHPNADSSTTYTVSDPPRGKNPVPHPSLPSPAPSSHNTSPASVADGNAEDCARVASPTGPPTRSEKEGMTASNGSERASALIQPPSSEAPADRTERPIDDNFWSYARRALDTFLHNKKHANALVLNVDFPRARLLRDACDEGDLMYLALHQTYCLLSVDSSALPLLPGFNPKSIQGFELITQLLLGNRQLSSVFLNWAANFPYSLPYMMDHPDYRGAVLQITYSLTCFAEGWSRFSQTVMQRRYPPLVDELVLQFGVRSSVLLSVIFLFMSRRIYGQNGESELRILFNRDKANYQRRFHESVSHDQMIRENDQLVEDYLSIHALRAPASMGVPAVARANPNIAAASNAPPPVHPSRITASSSTANAYVTAPVLSQAPSSRLSNPARLQNGTGTLSLPPLQQLQAPNSGTQATTLATTTARPPMKMPQPRGFQQSPSSSIPHFVNMAAPNSAGRGNQSLGCLPVGPRPQQQHLPITTGQQLQHSSGPQQQQPQQLSRPQQQQPPVYPRFLPPPGHIPPTTARPNPLRVALHQAHLRDPVKRLIGRGPEGDVEMELFQYMTSFAIPPTPLGPSECAFKWDFSLSTAECSKFPRSISAQMGYRSTRVFFDGGRIYHLRCIKVSPSPGDIGQHTWCVADTVWPSVIYVFVNGVEHFVRRKVHHGRDLPLDITDSLREGENEISFHFLRNTAECKDTLYALGVEAMDISSFPKARQLVGVLPATQTSARIQKQLMPGTSDDEVSIVNDDIAVNLVDPFTARIFTIPARGIVCRHLECFDLNTFITTRASRSGKAPMETDWRCPVCREDARPQSLVVDQFFINIRKEIEQKNQLEDAEAIRIKADGSWKLKATHDAPEDRPNKRKSVDAVNSLRAQRVKLDDSCRSSPRRTQTSEIIELD